MYIRGRPTVITIDDGLFFEYDFPSLESIFGFKDDLLYPQFANINPDIPALWPLLLEKALTKIGGNYLNVEGGWPYHTTRAILGCPVLGVFNFE